MAPEASKKRTHGKRGGNGHAPDGLADAITAVNQATLANVGAVRKDVFQTSRGEAIAINGISPWLIEGLGAGLRAQWAEDERGSLEPPTYEIPLPGGESETRPHDPTTLKTAADRKEWAEYQARVDAFGDELRERTMRLLLMRGVRSEPPADGLWLAEQEFMGIRIPKDAMERRYHWVRTEVVSSPEELTRLMTAIMALSGMREEALRAAEEAFRSAMEGPRRPETNGSADEGGRVVHKPNNGRGRGRSGLASKA